MTPTLSIRRCSEHRKVFTIYMGEPFDLVRMTEPQCCLGQSDEVVCCWELTPALRRRLKERMKEIAAGERREGR